MVDNVGARVRIDRDARVFNRGVPEVLRNMARSNGRRIVADDGESASREIG